MILIEGFSLALFPQQIKALLSEVDPRVLQMAGTVEALVAVGLLAAMFTG